MIQTKNRYLHQKHLLETETQTWLARLKIATNTTAFHTFDSVIRSSCGTWPTSCQPHSCP